MTSAALDTDNDEDRRLFEISDFDIGMNAAALNEELLVQDVPGEIVVSGKVDKVVESEREEKAEARPAVGNWRGMIGWHFFIHHI